VAPKKTVKKQKRAKGSSHSGDQTSEQERAQSSGLSVTKKSFTMKVLPRLAVGVKTGRGKLPPTSPAGGVAGRGSARAVDLFASSCSDEESVLVEPC
jgi:hypothetical protein